MPKFKILSNLVRAAIKTTTASTTTASDTTFKSLVSHFESITPPKPETSSKSKKQPETKPQSPPSPAVKSSPGALGLEDFYSDVLKIKSLGLEEADDEKVVENVFKTPWLSNWKKNNIGIQRKEISYERKQKWIFKNSQVYCFDRLVDTCAFKLGTDATMDVFGMLGRETGLKEFNALMKMCIEQCRETDDENVAKEQISEVLELFISMKEQGFPIEEETYGPFLMLLIDKGMVEEFYFFYGIIKDTNPSEIARLGYYDMCFYIRVNDEKKIQELCNCICTDYGDENISLRENYLLALCESDQKNYLLQLLETVDITKLSLLGNAVSIFKSLGRLSLEYYVEKFLLVLKNCDYGAEDISTLIFSYATSIPNLAVEDVVSKFKTLHTVMEMSPSSTSYERLIVYSCNSLKVHHAIDMVDQLCEEGFTISINTIHSMLNASEASLDFNLFSSLDSTSKTAFCFHVQRIYSLIYHLDLTPTNETFRRMIGLSVKMKDFDGAIGLLNDLKKLNLTPTAGMYNAIMDGYFREKNISGALMVLEQMKLADVKPDSATYSCLISNCDNEDQITKCYEEMKVAGIQVSKQSIYGAH
ncbi:pentatricopeptide repeat-containing protein At4g04790, mitochondrial isoform X4 [Populus trichocarpa]|uniref:pentatricopeptide repeat-containing protein At4g04790, mitochondrial isoform X4 n=1 Tax=Populus trichocarpa TaxID=3694 RepID=UPI000D18A919|nr:pentatricopeptide repeat-containing protein At4g04790, mitochondrial isoform X4 [Populus trichocarpa]|eukprot:XP_024437058.1 pentatricopeptide repeat-containing protein At4g04790, mitochondrial isoform X5 [Populus trichocarpa]